ncbi:hypothetical protein [Marispirochaeta aestuarii]|uniref:hydrogenase large subunit n=1 Tax=Marispirochaeta aestuarii TaxID=1963862 RepID=UPI0029C6E611|nr:hypothetical protein [Marispirochaeta aestuarii]
MSGRNNYCIETRNGSCIALHDIPLVPIARFRDMIIQYIGEGLRVSAFFGVRETEALLLYAVLADDKKGLLRLARSQLTKPSYHSLTPECPQLHLFEREIAEQFNLDPVGHPWLKPVRKMAAEEKFFRIDGDEVHEVAVGPVHAGVIEPGHFRFQCSGETVLHLEIALGYQHRGIERALRGGPDLRSLHYAETIAGDSTIAHATTFCQLLESLSGTEVANSAHEIRAIGLELERLANHVGDLGALSGDIGFLPTASYNGRIRGDFLNMSALLCGNRFGRGLVVPGGTGFDLSDEYIDELTARLERAERETRSAVELMWNSTSVLARLEDIGILNTRSAQSLGLVGPAARASGVAIDVRADHPSGAYHFHPLSPIVQGAGDVLSRAMVRWLEIQESLRLIADLCKTGAKSRSISPPGPLAPESLAVSMTEGWRGEVCHVAITDADGRFARYKIIDPSFHNWQGLARVMRNQEISDFPLCNKSFNLSYCGHDL